MDCFRIESYERIKAIYNGSQENVTILEAYAWSNVVQRGLLHGIPIWQYKNGNVLFETDRLESHLRETMAAYSDEIENIIALLKIKNVNIILSSDPYKISTDLEQDTRHSSWHREYLEGIKKAKAVLEEREETTDKFINCKKCKSNSVDTEQKQTRSSDEPMTIFCMCRKCGTRWRIE